MEPAGVSLPACSATRTPAGSRRSAAASRPCPGDAVLVYPPYSCGLCLACRRGNDMHCERHEFTGLSVDGGFADYVLVPRAVAPAPAARCRARRDRPARRRRPHRVPRGPPARPARGARHHRGRPRCRRRRPHRVAARARARLGRRHRGRHRRAPPQARGGARRGRGRRGGTVDAVRDLTGGRGADLVFDFVGTDQTHADSLAMLARGGTYSVIGYGGTISTPSARSSSTSSRGRQPRRHLGRPVGAPAAARAGRSAEDRDAPAGLRERRARSTLRDGDITGRAVLVPG